MRAVEQVSRALAVGDRRPARPHDHHPVPGRPRLPAWQESPGARALKYRAGDLAAYLNARPGRRGPNRPKGGQGSGTRGSGAPRRARARAA